MFYKWSIRSWATWLSWLEFWYNTSFQLSIKCSSFKVVYGRDPPTLIHFEKGSTAMVILEEQVIEHDAILDDIKASLIKEKQRIKKYVDMGRRVLEFQVGKLVYLKLQPY